MKKNLLLPVLIILSLSLSAQVNLGLGLVASYYFNGNAIDSSGNGLNGTINGVTATTDRFGLPNSAYNFSFSYITVPSSALFNTGTGMSVSVWVNLTNAANNQKVIGRTDGNFNSGFILAVQNNQVYPELWDNSGTHFTVSNGSVPSSVWTHLLMTWASGGHLIAYVNGVAVDSVTASANPIGSNSDDLVIGVSPWSLSPTYFPVDGGIDDIKIYNRAVNSDEALALYNQNPPGTSSLSKTSELNVFPNPSSTGIFNVRLNAGVKTVRVVNALGEVFQERNALNEKSITLDLSSCSKGVYILELGTTNGITKKEIVIN